MKHEHEHDELWNDLANDAALREFRRNALNAALSAARRRGLMRRAAGAACVVGALALLFVVQLQSGRRDYTQSANQSEAPPTIPESAPDAAMAPHDEAPVTERPPAPEILSDDDLLALFPDRALALIGPPGSQRLVDLTRLPAPVNAPESFSD